MKENARKLLAKVVIMRSSPSGKRSENAGIHAFFQDSAAFTVSYNTGKRPQKAEFHSLTAVNWRFFHVKTQCNPGKQDVYMDNGTNARIKRSENFWKKKDFPLGES